jgi:rhamnosyltransferase subunit B
MSRDILLVDRAPHQLLFPRAAAIVHQGGIGTTAQALRSGRPAIVVPHSHDQPDNAFRVTSLGVARTIFPGAYRAARVARELSRLLGDSTSASNSATGSATSYVARAAKLAESVRAENGAEAAADAIARVSSAATPVQLR